MLICRPFITLKNGTKLYASSVGKKAFCWEVSDEKHKEYLEKKTKETEESK
ncbi:hypothetical protein U9K47_13515 [Bacillus toyonensis]|uniref:hypothetical protein n=1 Tax=Bacillus toyonensis TaxID=155322 RepID=UPI003467764F